MATTLLIEAVETTVNSHCVHLNMPSKGACFLKTVNDVWLLAVINITCNLLVTSSLSRYIGYMERIKIEDSKKDKREVKKKGKDKDAKAKNQADGTELTDIKVEVASSRANHHLQV